MPEVAAEIAVPFPLSTPVTDVVSVMAGVVVDVATVPAKPLAVTTETEVTVPFVAGAAKVGTAPAPAEVKTCPTVPVATATGAPVVTA